MLDGARSVPCLIVTREEEQKQSQAPRCTFWVVMQTKGKGSFLLLVAFLGKYGAVYE